MNGLMRKLLCSIGLAYVAFVAPAVRAETELGLGMGFGADMFRSYELNASTDLFNWPLQLDVTKYLGRSDGVTVMDNTEIGVDWFATKALALGVRHRKAEGDYFHTSGNDIHAGFDLNSLWDSKATTTVDFGLGWHDYALNPARPQPPALVAILPTVRKSSVSLTQEIAAGLSLTAGINDYRYNRDPVALARAVIRRLGRPVAAVYELTSFTDRSTELGVHWKATERLTLDLSYQRSNTVLDQRQEATRLRVEFQLSKLATVEWGISRSTANTARSPSGIVIAESGKSTLNEIAARFQFD
jgi:hypothetical protein